MKTMIEAPPKPEPVLMEGWLNLYSDQNINGTMQPSKRSADDVASEGRVECRRITWMSDGSPVPASPEEYDHMREMAKVIQERDDWKDNYTRLTDEMNAWKRKALERGDMLDRQAPVVDAAVAVSAHYNATCFGSIAALHEAVRAYQQTPKKTAAEAVANVAEMMGPVKNCTSCRSLADNGSCREGVWSLCVHSEYRNWEAKRHD